MTSLMGTCTEDVHDCSLGSLRYRSDFEPTATACFGPGGSYRMAQLGGVWILLTHNAGDDPLDFMVSTVLRYIIAIIWPAANRDKNRCSGIWAPTVPGE